MDRRLGTVVVAALLAVWAMGPVVAGENPAVDTTRVRQDSTQVPVPDELVLEEIHIEALIEKPNVAILPARVETDFGEVQFIDRAFAPELKQVPSRLWLDLDSEVAARVEKLKALLKREKAKTKE